jgi:hypothetical protein
MREKEKERERERERERGGRERARGGREMEVEQERKIERMSERGGEGERREGDRETQKVGEGARVWQNDVIRSNYVTMVDNNPDRSHIAMRPVYAFVEYMFFISLYSYHMLLLSCHLHNWQPHRLVRLAMRKSVRNLIFIAVTHPFTHALLT